MTMQPIANAAAVAVMLMAATASWAQEKMPETPWFPLAVGTTWHYRSGDSKFQIRVAAHEKVGADMAAKLETVRDGKVIATEHVRVTADGVRRLDVAYGGIKEDIQPPILLLPLPPKKGDAFNVDSKINNRVYKGTFKIGEDEVKVPAGTYKALMVVGQDLEVEGVKPSMTTWYAENVGMVKQRISVGETKREFELEKFEPGK
jgi:hypothetical protein